MPVSICTNEICFRDLTKIESWESDAHNKNQLKKCIFFVFFQVQGDSLFFFFFFFDHFYFPAQLVGDFTLSDLLGKPWSQVSSLLAPGTCLQFLSRIGFSIPTARRFSSNVLVGVVSRLVCKIRVIWFADIRVWWFHPLAFKKSS